MLGERIAILRQSAGLTQKELAKRIHVSPGTLGMYEQGRRTPDIAVLVVLAQELEVTADYLVTGKPRTLCDIVKITDLLVPARLDNVTHKNNCSLSAQIRTKLIADILRL